MVQVRRQNQPSDLSGGCSFWFINPQSAGADSSFHKGAFEMPPFPKEVARVSVTEDSAQSQEKVINSM
jgi:hypothetical protein